MNYDIFISYSRKDIDLIRKVKSTIEDSCNVECWMDLKAIESGSSRFTKDIINGINNCKVFLFMLSKNSQESKYALRELDYAEKKNKQVVLVYVDNCEMNDEFQFRYGMSDTIDWNDKLQRDKLLRDLRKWIGSNVIEKKENKEQLSETNHTKPTVKILEKYNKNTILGITLILLGLILAVFAVYMWTKDNNTPAEQDIILEEVDTSKSTNIHNNPSKPSEINTSISIISNTTTQASTENVSSTVPKGAINGKFSVSENKQVYFSKGNLQYKASTKTWRFAEHQWDYVGEDNNNISPTYDGWIDLFGWGTGNNPTRRSGYDSDYKIFEDWGNYISANSVHSIWRTLTYEEWEYVLEKRHTKSNTRYVLAVIDDIYGVIIFPDEWIDSSINFNNINKPNDNYLNNTISLSEWIDKLEKNGAVFLPTAGFRYHSKTYDINSNGWYWTSDIIRGYIDYSYYVDVHPGYVYTTYQGRSYGCSVRLVCDIQ